MEIYKEDKDYEAFKILLKKHCYGMVANCMHIV